jgi:hypothetical protein
MLACFSPVDTTVPNTLDVLHWVGLNKNFERLMFTVTVRKSSGIPSRIYGSGSVVTVSCAVRRSM